MSEIPEHVTAASTPTHTSHSTPTHITMGEIPEYVTTAVKGCVAAAVCAAMKTEVVQECVIAAVCAAMKTEIVQECVTSAVYAAMKEREKQAETSKHKHARDESPGQVAEDSLHRPMKRLKSSRLLAESLASTPGNSVQAASLSDMPLASTPGNSVQAASLSDMPVDMSVDILLLIADRTDIETLNSLSRACKRLSGFLQGHREIDAKVLRAVEKGDVDDLKAILQSPSATARGGGLLAKVVKAHTIDMASLGPEYDETFLFPSLAINEEALTERRREGLSRTTALMRVLLEAGADIDECDKLGLTALHYATACDDKAGTGVDLVRVLLDFGADINSMGTIGLTPLHSAVQGLMQHRPVIIPRPEMVSLLVGAGANVRGRDKYGLTPLHVAALSGLGNNIFGILENAGAVINIDGHRGYPLSDMCSESCFYHYHDSSCEAPPGARKRRSRTRRSMDALEHWLPAYGIKCCIVVSGGSGPEVYML